MGDSAAGLPPHHPIHALADTPYLRAARGLPAPHRPVWFQRQAGRHLPEYRALRGEGSIGDAIRRPELATEITLQPVRRYGVDAAILFSDIVTPVAAIGFGVDIRPGIGPVTDVPFRHEDDLHRLVPLDPPLHIPYVIETVERLVAELEVPLIGFAGAPFTLASYLVEGRPSRSYVHTKVMMRSRPDLWHALCDRLADMALASLRAQVTAGASAVQLFDSWAGALTRRDYERFALPHSRKVLTGLADLGVPRAHFGVATGELLHLMGAPAGADVVGIDWRVPLDEARRRVGAGTAVQGNLDPAWCLAPWPVVEAAVREVLDAAGPAPGHIFNLGHGVLPETDPATMARIVRYVQDDR